MINWPSLCAYCAVRGSSNATWRGTKNRNALFPEDFVLMSPPGILERLLDYSQWGQLTSAAYGIEMHRRLVSYALT